MKTVIYTRTECPWCESLKKLCQDIGMPFEERNVSTNAAYLMEFKERMWGSTTTPALFFEWGSPVPHDESAF